MGAGPSACESDRRIIRQVVLHDSQGARPKVGDIILGCRNELRIVCLNFEPFLKGSD
jgi:hypothetical protein